jgi:F-type H+-transporting ATPase subunit gamma
MATLREVRKRIKSVKSTRRITGAMEMVAASKLRRAQQRVEQARPYAEKMDEMLQHLAAGTASEIIHPFFDVRHIKRKTLVVITSDRGLCGSYNANVIRKSLEWIRENNSVPTELVLLGKKGNDFFRRRPIELIKFYGDWGGVLDYDKAKSAVSFLTNCFVAGETDQIDLIFTRFESLVKYRVTLQQYLPIPKPHIQAHEKDVQREYIFEPSPDQIYSALMPGYATTRLVTALAESFASEHGSRMIAMNAATKNAGEMIDNLTLDYNKARQAQITKELLEIVGGAEALKG